MVALQLVVHLNGQKNLGRVAECHPQGRLLLSTFQEILCRCLHQLVSNEDLPLWHDCSSVAAGFVLDVWPPLKETRQ
jgi:hypothetical protein